MMNKREIVAVVGGNLMGATYVCNDGTLLQLKAMFPKLPMIGPVVRVHERPTFQWEVVLELPIPQPTPES